jgi:hypothetical protein
MVRFALPVILLAASAPAFADEVTATVIAFDRVDSVIVLDDKTVFNVTTPDVIPDGLKAGDTVTIDYKSDGDNGVTAINSIKKM